MTDKQYTEVTAGKVLRLKQQGYTTFRVILRDTDNPYKALVELIPGNQQGFEGTTISIDSKEAEYYIDAESPMAKYVVDEKYLNDKTL